MAATWIFSTGQPSPLKHLLRASCAKKACCENGIIWYYLYFSIVSLLFITNKMLWPLFLCKDTNLLNLPPLSTCWWPPAPKEHVRMMLSRDKECPQLDKWSTDWLCIFQIILVGHFPNVPNVWCFLFCAFDISLCLSLECNASVVYWILHLFLSRKISSQ